MQLFNYGLTYAYSQHKLLNGSLFLNMQELV